MTQDKAPAASVLIVEGDRVVADPLLRTLRSAGYETLWARDVSEARELARCDLPDLILVDAALMGCNGVETGGGPCAGETPVILMSPQADRTAMLDGLRSGAVDWVGKPCDPEELLARVGLRLRLHRSSQRAVDQEAAKLQQLRSAQMQMLPLPQDVPGSNFGVGYFPVLEAGGDHYDVFRVSASCTGYFVADISGHDLAASYVGPALKAVLRQAAQPGVGAVQAMEAVNRTLLHIMRDGLHLTACYLQLDRERGLCTVVGAGHTPVVHLVPDGDVTLIDTDGDVLGAFANVEFGCHERPVRPGDRLFLYTDGLTEALGGDRRDRRAGVDLLVDSCRAAVSLPMEFAVPEILIQTLGGNRDLEDDVLLLGTEV